MSMLFDSMKIGRLDEEAQPSAYPRRRIIKAGLLIGAVAAIAMKVGAAAPLRALDEQQVETVRDRQRRPMMPLARIDLSKDAPPERVRVVSEAIYHAMVEVANVPLHDKFQVVTRHAPDEIIYPEEGYLGLNYTRDLIIIQVTWVSGRSVDVKKKFFHRIADEIHEKAHVRKDGRHKSRRLVIRRRRNAICAEVKAIRQNMYLM